MIDEMPLMKLMSVIQYYFVVKNVQMSLFIPNLFFLEFHQTLTPNTVAKCGQVLMWGTMITQLALQIPTYHTPSSCVMCNDTHYISW